MRIFPSKVFVYFVESHKSFSIHFFSLVQRSEFNILRGFGIIDERTFKGVQIVSTDRDQSSLSADILVKLILKIDETIISVLIEGNISQNCADNKRSDLLSLFKKEC